MKKQFLSALFLLMILFIPVGQGIAQWKLPRQPSPELFGNILMNRTSEAGKVKPAAFSHWSHRMYSTCTVCHVELEFTMKLKTTEITEKANQQGKYCGAASCHDGKAAFGHAREHCDKCHNNDIGYGREKFAKTKNFPRAGFGNKIDWDKALKDGLIQPKTHLQDPVQTMEFKKDLLLEAEWAMIPPAKFSHQEHLKWLDCSNCHPDIFNIQKKTTKHFSMDFILAGKFCGFCHGKVAFPINDCKRCHPDMKRKR